MSDLANAVFGGQLMGHVIAGDELTSSVIQDAAMKASLADGLSVTDESLSDVESELLQSKVAQTVAEEGHYSTTDLVHDQVEAELDAGLAEGLM